MLYICNAGFEIAMARTGDKTRDDHEMQWMKTRKTAANDMTYEASADSRGREPHYAGKERRIDGGESMAAARFGVDIDDNSGDDSTWR